MPPLSPRLLSRSEHSEAGRTSEAGVNVNLPLREHSEAGVNVNLFLAIFLGLDGIIRLYGDEDLRLRATYVDAAW